MDLLCLYYCSANGHTLLSNDKRLRRACKENGVAVHGSLWVVLELHHRAICPADVLCGWLSRWEKELKTRLPTTEVAQVRRVLGCPLPPQGRRAKAYSWDPGTDSSRLPENSLAAHSRFLRSRYCRIQFAPG